MSRDKQQDEQVALEVVEAVLGGAALKDVQGISDEHMNSLYAFAYEVFTQARQ